MLRALAQRFRQWGQRPGESAPASPPAPAFDNLAPGPSAVPGVSVDIAHLNALEGAARDFHFHPGQPVHSVLAGRHGSRVRGRGLAFEELRQYVAGDDIRSMDWRVTARTGKPYVRVYTEEKDRPVLLVVDQRINMFFGSRRAMKSVTAAEAAALAAWRVLADGDRVGGIVFNDTAMDTFAPKRSRAAVEQFLGGVVRRNAQLPADVSAGRVPAQLNLALERCARMATHDCLVVVISDFDGHDKTTRQWLLGIASRNDVLTVLVHDPFLSALPQSGSLVVSDGELQVELSFGDMSMRRSIAEFFTGHGKHLVDWHQAIGVPMFPLSAAEETAGQIRRFLGGAQTDGRAHRRARGGVGR
ncbi:MULTISPECIES: DUF58 domain-containing protein [Pandoraea]|uniref:DUF58 domain-containing protein n=1 Tax=Pandoraea TaxID=93217 RepID=UPI001F5DA860|nr:MULTISPECIES: DUF58 domain-containing protein [Pandoraea]MCI3208582.1 DUF58 domain-containing protein [Pandoraea sp. LA3]MDN4586611.1 DUF58 domain-containing protein [Pandoraea capi]